MGSEDWINTLYYGDNLDILKEYITSSSVDLIYLDPPFNSNRNYNVLFKDEGGNESQAQITAFEDTWHWGSVAEKIYHQILTEAPEQVGRMIASFRESIGTNQMLAYLVEMTIRLVELHRVLRDTGSIYLHCDPTASHYLKIVMDSIFGVQNFRNEIIWKRSDAHNDATQGAKQFGRIHDTLLFYTKTSKYTFNTIWTPLSKETADKWYKHVDEKGRRYNMDNLTAAKAGGDTLYAFHGVKPPQGRYWAYSLEKMEKLFQEGRIVFSNTGKPYLKRYLGESKGTPLQDIWLDIDMLRGFSGSQERLGYQTQKPLALLERIVNVSSNKGDVVLDPFCGCGTAIAAAQKLMRKWIGIDITHLSIALQKYRLKSMFPRIKFNVIGEPKDLASASQLALDNRFQFQWWALSLIRAKPVGSSGESRQGKKGHDKGIDGVINFVDKRGKLERVIVQVKSGNVLPAHIRDLIGTIQRENAALGVFIALEKPSRDMSAEAASAGFYHSDTWDQDYPKVQILTIKDLLAGAEVKMPPQLRAFQQIDAVKEKGGDQISLLFSDNLVDEPL